MSGVGRCTSIMWDMCGVEGRGGGCVRRLGGFYVERRGGEWMSGMGLNDKRGDDSGSGAMA